MTVVPDARNRKLEQEKHRSTGTVAWTDNRVDRVNPM
jgi:hypothetical protein